MKSMDLLVLKNDDLQEELWLTKGNKKRKRKLFIKYLLSQLLKSLKTLSFLKIAIQKLKEAYLILKRKTNHYYRLQKIRQSLLR